MKKNVRQLFLLTILVLGTLVSCSKDDANNSPSGSSATVSIGNQIWMKKNLDVDKYRNGDPIPQVQDAIAWANLTTGAWCYFSNDPAKGTTYGKLYNCYAVNDSRGLAPLGYHIPADVEWTTLVTFLGGPSGAGGKMKEAGTTHWITPNTGATNSSGFTGLPGGVRNHDGSFDKLGLWGNWWSSTNDRTLFASYCDLDYLYLTAEIYSNVKQVGLSVRCLKD